MTHQKIKNINYREFLDRGMITTLSINDIKKALHNIDGKHIKEARALLICLYYTGARPNEVLKLKGKDVSLKGQYVIVQMLGSKRGLNRPIYLPYGQQLVKELYQYSRALFHEMFLFFNYRSSYKRKKINKQGKEVIYHEVSSNLAYHVYKWFQGVLPESIPPYYLRHNRFSKLMSEGATAEEIRILKGGKTMDSVTPYLHLSTKTARKLANKMR